MQEATGGFSVTPSHVTNAMPQSPNARLTSSRAPLALAATLSVTTRHVVPRAASASWCWAMQPFPVNRRVGMK